MRLTERFRSPLSPELLALDADAISQLDDDLDEHLLGDRVVRVKLWASDGTIIYSDAEGLIGEVHELDHDHLEVHETAVAVAEMAEHIGPENRFEVDLGPLLEVYLPVEGPSGEPLLFEAYFDSQSITRSSQRLVTDSRPRSTSAHRWWSETSGKSV